jgi:long-chain acyl-CoA synthetase
MDYGAMTSLPRMVFDNAARAGERSFLRAKRDGVWRSWSWTTFRDEATALARALLAQGVARGDRVAIVAENRPEWIIAHYAIMSAGAITVPCYSTNTIEDNRHVFANAGVVGAIAGGRGLAENAIQAARRAPHCRFVIAIDPPPVEQDVGPAIQGWAQALTTGRARTDDIDAIIASLTRSDIACIIHTSGTGGLPKGVSLHHGAILTNCHGAYEVLKELGLGHEIALSFLPLSHSYEHLFAAVFIPSISGEICFAEGTDKLAANLQEIRPTLMTAVPRLYETLHGRITQQIAREKPIKQKLFARALELGQKRYRNPDSLSIGEKLVDAVLDRLVRGKMRQRFGGRLKALVSGGAPLNPDVGLFFTALGLLLLQGYGQTETAPLVSVNLSSKSKLDTVGPPCIGVEVRIAGDGEILVRGENVMRGYWNDEASTQAAIQDGWLHTGDIGEFDADGYLRITDRKKDFIKNSGGDMIAPARIEGMLALQPEIAQVMIHGDRRPYLVAIVVPREDFAKQCADEKALRDGIDAAIDRVNKQLQGAERIRKFTFTREAFTLDNEMMTPTMKIKRHKIRARYGADLEALYG